MAEAVMKVKPNRKFEPDIDQSPAAKTEFGPVNIKVQQIDTAVDLLKCKENSVVLQVIAALDKFAVEVEDNVHLLYHLNILDNLLDLTEHSDVYIRRFCFKHMCQLCVIPEVKTRLASEEFTMVPFFIDVLQKEEDIIFQEFSSYILAELTELHAVSAKITDTDILETLFLRLRSADPDVQKNSLQIMFNILQDPLGIEAFKKCPEFRFEPIVAHLQSEFPVIQSLACQVIEYLTKHWYDPMLTDLFRISGCFEEFFKVLENGEWDDLHPIVLSVLSNCVDNPTNAKYIDSSGFINKLITYMKKVKDLHLLEPALDVISKISATEEGREALHKYHMEEQLCQIINEGKIIEPVYLTLANLVSHVKMLEYISKQHILNNVTDVLTNDELPWETRKAAVTAILHMFKADRAFVMEFIDGNKQDKLLWLIHQPSDKIPLDIVMEAVTCLSVLGLHEGARSKLATTETVDALLHCLQDRDAESRQLKILALNCLSVFICEKKMKECFVSAGGVDTVFSCLQDYCSLPLQLAAVSFIQLAANDAPTAAAFIKADMLHWMLEQKKVRKAVPVWETAIEILFKSYLPAKFGYTGRLDFNDKTEDGFYITRTHEEKFPLLEDLILMEVSPIRPIYVANFISVVSSPPSISSTKGIRSNRTQKKQASPSKHRRKSSDRSMSESDGISSLISVAYGSCAPDPYLPEYLKQVKHKFNLIDKQLSAPSGPKLRTIKDKVRALAKFVCAQLSGTNPNRECDKHMRELHLNELKVDLGTNVIPIGHVRIGLHLERAFLYKVLADRVDLPCALVRGEYGRAWVEVAIPQENDLHPKSTDIKDEPCVGIISLPPRLLKPNHIVDLMYNIGGLIPMETYEAKKYCHIPQ